MLDCPHHFAVGTGKLEPFCMICGEGWHTGKFYNIWSFGCFPKNTLESAQEVTGKMENGSEPSSVLSPVEKGVTVCRED